MTLNEELNKITSIFACPVDIHIYTKKNDSNNWDSSPFVKVSEYLSFLAVQDTREFLRWKSHMTHNLLKPTRTYVA